MKRKHIGLLMLSLFIATLATPTPAAERNSSVARWDFDIYLNDKKVGQHFYEITDVNGVTRVQSEAKFKYTILLIPAYRYEHSNAERWADNCLVGFDAKTNANGERTEVSGQQYGTGFIVRNGETPVELPECIMSFAYWNPEFLDQPRLLNPQTGEYVDVRVEKVGNETLMVRGERVAATRFKLTAYEVDLTLWYSPDDEWLALESIAKGGHVIRYELS